MLTQYYQLRCDNKHTLLTFLDPGYLHDNDSASFVKELHRSRSRQLVVLLRAASKVQQLYEALDSAQCMCPRLALRQTLGMPNDILCTTVTRAMLLC